jgi:ribosome recycling factor
MVKDVLNDTDAKMKKTAEVLRHTLGTIRTGRASPALIENIVVDYYGSEVPINQLANISAPEARQLLIQPWDANAVKAIEKAIQQSDLGINPSNDGRVIRLSIPQLTEQRRKELVKMVKSRVEESKVALRNVRHDGQNHLKKLEADKQISEDELKRALEKLQELTDRHQKELDAVGSAKEAEVMEV